MNKKPKLTDAQRSFLKRLYSNGGHDSLHNATFQTAQALHDKGMIVVTIYDTHNGHVEITEEGAMVVEALERLLASVSGKISAYDVLQGTALSRLKEKMG